MTACDIADYAIWQAAKWARELNAQEIPRAVAARKKLRDEVEAMILEFCNALEGIEDPAEFVAECQSAAFSQVRQAYLEITKLRAKRDELLAACRMAASTCRCTPSELRRGHSVHCFVPELLIHIARAEGREP